MTTQELMTFAQRHIRSLTATIDRLNEIGAQDELRSISLHLTRLAFRAMQLGPAGPGGK